MSEEQRLNNLGIDPDLRLTDYAAYLRKLAELKERFAEELEVTPLVQKHKDVQVNKGDKTQTLE